MTGVTTSYEYDKLGRLAKELQPYPNDWLIDDDDTNNDDYAEFETWSPETVGVNDDSRSVSNNSAATATWTFDEVEAGKTYEVVATWPADSNNGREVPFTVRNSTGGFLGNQALVDQSLNPEGHSVLGKGWQSLGIFPLDTGSLLTVTLTGVAGEQVVADAVQVLEVRPETHYGYDSVGNLLYVTDSLGDSAMHQDHTTWYAYDDLNRQTHVIDALDDDPIPTDRFNPLSATLDHPTVTTYDPAGRIEMITDPEGNETEYFYDNLSRVVAETNDANPDRDPDARTFEYDAASNLVRRTDYNGRVTEYAYDPLGRRIKEDWLDGADVITHTINSMYDDAGQLYAAKHVDIQGDTGAANYYLYDGLGQVIRERTVPGDLQPGSAAFPPFSGSLPYGSDDFREYLIGDVDLGDVFLLDLYSNEFPPRLRFRAPSGREYVADHESIASLEVTANEPGAWTVVVTSSNSSLSGDYTLNVTHKSLNSLLDFDYTYDAAGNLTEAKDSGDGIKFGITTYESYDDLHRLTAVKQSGYRAKRVEFSYHANGQPEYVRRYVGLEPTGTLAATSHSAITDYDGVGRLTGLEHTMPNFDVTYDWTYDAAGRITASSHTKGPTVENTTAITYDATHQQTAATHNYQDDDLYTYDDNGNRDDADYDVGENNRMTSDATHTYEYDENGNRTKKYRTSDNTDVTEYAWDYRNRLTKVTHYPTDGGAADKLVTYTYDAHDRRVRKTVDIGANGSIDDFLYNVYQGDHAALEFTDPDGLGDSTQSESVAHRYLYGQAVDQILAIESGGYSLLWGLPDHQGSIRDVIWATGALNEHRQFDSFGDFTPGAADFIFGYTGRPFDADADMYDYRGRYYDAATGRFASEDPIGFDAGDANLYRYVGNSPWNHTDPSGLDYGGFFNSVSQDPWMLTGNWYDNAMDSAMNSAVQHWAELDNTIATRQANEREMWAARENQRIGQRIEQQRTEQFVNTSAAAYWNLAQDKHGSTAMAKYTSGQDAVGLTPTQYASLGDYQQAYGSVYTAVANAAGLDQNTDAAHQLLSDHHAPVLHALQQTATTWQEEEDEQKFFIRQRELAASRPRSANDGMGQATGIRRVFEDPTPHQATVAYWDMLRKEKGLHYSIGMPGGMFDHAVIVAGAALPIARYQMTGQSPLSVSRTQQLSNFAKEPVPRQYDPVTMTGTLTQFRDRGIMYPGATTEARIRSNVAASQRGGAATRSGYRQFDQQVTARTAPSRLSGFEAHGFNPPPGTRIIPAGIPDSWRIAPTKGPGGVLYYDPTVPYKSNAVRVMPGDPLSGHPNSQSPYVRWQLYGQPLDVNGNVLPSRFTPDAHIPLQDFNFNPQLFR